MKTTIKTIALPYLIDSMNCATPETLYATEAELTSFHLPSLPQDQNTSR
ncbi:hypothetical protein [Marivirga sericea]|nr:hypothetical protein [Marivirga sericea]